MKTVLYFFGILHDEDIGWFARTGRLRIVAPGELLIRQGEDLDHLFIVIAGRARVALRGGRQLAQRGPGDMLGEMSFVDAAPPSADVIAETALTVLCIDRNEMRARLEADNGFAARFYRALAILLSDRLRAAQAPVESGESTGRPESPGLAVDELDETVLDTVSMAGLRFHDLLAALGQR